MQLHENKHIDFFLRLLYLAIFIAAGYFILCYGIKWVAPLIIAYLLSLLIIHPVNFLDRKKIMPRGLAAGLCTLLIVSAVGFGLYFIISRLVIEGAGFIESLPSLIDSLSEKLVDAQASLDHFLRGLPYPLSEAPLFQFETWLSSLKFPQISASQIITSVSHAASSFPTALLTIVFIFVSTYFLGSQRAEIGAFITRQLPPPTAEAFSRLRRFLSSSVFKWVKAQLILICITFCELFIGFLIIRQPYTLFLAMIIAVIDALPILGVGTVLIPWAAISLLAGDWRKAVSLCIIYGVILVVRNSIEPRIVGAQLGLHPFVTLLCIYFGFRIAGFAGMFLMPVLVLTLIKLQDWDYIHIWN